MLRLRRIAAILLVSLWLPALLHCRLEAAGVLFGAACCEATHGIEESPADACADDACGVAEGEFTSPANVGQSASAPVLYDCLGGIVGVSLRLPLAAPPDTGVIEAEAAPPEISRSWIFVSRAAPSPRAPSLA